MEHGDLLFGEPQDLSRVDRSDRWRFGAHRKSFLIVLQVRPASLVE